MAENLKDRGKKWAANLRGCSRLLICGLAVFVFIRVVCVIGLILSIVLKRPRLRSTVLLNLLRLCGLILLMMSALLLHGTIVMPRCLDYRSICLMLVRLCGNIMKLGVSLKLFWKLWMMLWQVPLRVRAVWVR